MKPYILIACLLVGCATRPKVTFVDPNTGVTTTLDLGGVFMAETEGVLASVEHGKTKVKYSSIKENSTEVPKHLITVGGVVAGGYIAAGTERVREVEATKRHSADSAVILKGTKDPNIIPKDPNIIPLDPNLP